MMVQNVPCVRVRGFIMDICKVDKCQGIIDSLGFCSKHVKRFRKYGDPLITKPTGRQLLHGLIHTPEYCTWQGMKARCYNTNALNYHRYGGRGIKVCENWRNSFVLFLDDMGKRPFPKAQIDRINNDGNYEPLNCRWTTQKINIQGRSTTKLTPSDINIIKRSHSKGFSQKEIAQEYGVDPSTINNIIKRKTWKNIN